MKQPQLKMHISVRTQQQQVEWVSFSSADSFSYHIEGPRLGLDTYFEAYLQGEDPPLPPLNLAPLSPFTRTVLETLRTIPYGKTLTYRELAVQIGCPRGARAVGGALGRNPFPLLLPCHRILAQGGIGGFSAGLEFKYLLLNHELALSSKS